MEMHPEGHGLGDGPRDIVPSSDADGLDSGEHPENGRAWRGREMGSWRLEEGWGGTWGVSNWSAEVTVVPTVVQLPPVVQFLNIRELPPPQLPKTAENIPVYIIDPRLEAHEIFVVIGYHDPRVL